MNKYYHGAEIMTLGLWITLALCIVVLFFDAATAVGIAIIGVYVSCFAGYLFGEVGGDNPIIPIFRRKD